MSRAIEIVVVSSPGCHYCDESLLFLGDLAERMPLTIRVVALSSDEGRSLLVRHRVPFPPILLIDGEFFGYGRISRRKLEASLTGRVTSERAG